LNIVSIVMASNKLRKQNSLRVKID
jgi:hypothetical protein